MSQIHRLLALILFVAAVSPLQAEVIDIDNATLKRLIDKGTPLVDIRRLDEWQATGVIDESHLITFFDADGGYDASAWRLELDTIVSRDEPVVLICRTGRRTELVSRWLSEQQSYSTIYNVRGGILSWIDDGRQTIQSP